MSDSGFGSQKKSVLMHVDAAGYPNWCCMNFMVGGVAYPISISLLDLILEPG